MRMSARRPPLGFRTSALRVGALAALCCAGCGSTPLSVTQLRSSVSRICQTATRLAKDVPAATPAAASAPSPAASAYFLRGGARILRRELADLRALRPPSSLSQQYSVAVDAVSQELGFVVTSQHNLLLGGDPVVEIKLLQQRLTPLETREASAWGALGVSACTNQ